MENQNNKNFGTMPPATEGMEIPANPGIQITPSAEVPGTPPPEPTPPKPATDPFIAPASVTIESKKGGRGFGLFVVIGAIIIIVVYASVAFLYLQNKKLKSPGEPAEKSAVVTESTLTPTPEFKKEFITVMDGNIAYKDGVSEPRILVRKSDYSGSGITGFLKVSVSPDNSKICFESWPPATQPALYMSNADGTSVLEVSLSKKNCLWTNDSKKLLYVNIPAPNSHSDIYMYDLDTKEEKNLTERDVELPRTRNYELVGLSADGSKVICKFETKTTQAQSGECEIDLTTFEIVYL